MDKISFLDWKMKYLIHEAETIQKTTKTLKYFDNELINKINRNEMTSTELLNKLTNDLCFNSDCIHSVSNTRHRCVTNEINIGYILYQNFRGQIICKDVEIETITLGESRKTKKPMWFIKNEMSTHDQIGQITNKFKHCIVDLLNATELTECARNKLVNHIRTSSSVILFLRELFR